MSVRAFAFAAATRQCCASPLRAFATTEALRPRAPPREPRRRTGVVGAASLGSAKDDKSSVEPNSAPSDAGKSFNRALSRSTSDGIGAALLATTAPELSLPYVPVALYGGASAGYTIGAPPTYGAAARGGYPYPW